MVTRLERFLRMKRALGSHSVLFIFRGVRSPGALSVDGAVLGGGEEAVDDIDLLADLLIGRRESGP